MLRIGKVSAELDSLSVVVGIMNAWNGSEDEMKKMQSKIRRTIVIFVYLCLGAIPAVAMAQNYDNPGLGELPVVAHPQDFKPLGIRAGGFMLHPGVQLAAEFNDNVFYTAEDKQNDTIWH